MKEWYVKSKNKILSVITCLVVCCTFLLSGFDSHAVIGTGENGLDFYVPYSKPDSYGMGYVSVVALRDGEFRLETYIWNIQPYSTVEGSVVPYGQCGVLINNNTVTLSLTNTVDDGSLIACNLFLLYYSDSAGIRMDKLITGTYESGVDYSLNYNNYNQVIAGYEIGGNAYLRNGSSLVSSLGGKFYYPNIHWNEDGKDEIAMLNEIYSILAENNSLLELYLPKLSSMNNSLSSIRTVLYEIKSATGDDANTMNEFGSNSSTQTDELNSLNQQTQVDKIDVDSASQTIDENLNIQTDANYGVLLSTFTSNDRILTMLLLVASVSLISFVLFGKR